MYVVYASNIIFGARYDLWPPEHSKRAPFKVTLGFEVHPNYGIANCLRGESPKIENIDFSAVLVFFPLFLKYTRYIDLLSQSLNLVRLWSFFRNRRANKVERLLRIFMNWDRTQTAAVSCIVEWNRNSYWNFESSRCNMCVLGTSHPLKRILSCVNALYRYSRFVFS